MTETITIDVDARIVERLAALSDSPGTGLDKATDVVAKLIDRAQQGVYRPGAWERDWLIQAFGDEWTHNLRPDPAAPVFDMPR